jgi:tRNA C32,U32 (ribose-2'-O)-methylase TrmJ
VAYELRMSSAAEGAPVATAQLAPVTELNAMLRRLEQALITIGFIPEGGADHIMFALQAVLARGGVLPRELDILNGLARQIRWFAQEGHATIAAKRQAGRPAR